MQIPSGTPPTGWLYQRKRALFLIHSTKLIEIQLHFILLNLINLLLECLTWLVYTKALAAMSVR